MTRPESLAAARHSGSTEPLRGAHAGAAVRTAATSGGTRISEEAAEPRSGMPLPAPYVWRRGEAERHEWVLAMVARAHELAAARTGG